MGYGGFKGAADYFLESDEVCGRQGSRVVSWWRELCWCTVGRCHPGVRCMLEAFGRLVLELGESLVGRGAWTCQWCMRRSPNPE